MADYTRLAALMASHKELALFRKFAKLNTKCLLHMQSELIHLEAELENIELENGHSGDSEKLAFQVSVFDLKRSSGTQKDLQWRKALEIREKLKHYSLSNAAPVGLKRPSHKLIRRQTKLSSAMSRWRTLRRPVKDISIC